jgi:hypothetical protein
MNNRYQNGCLAWRVLASLVLLGSTLAWPSLSQAQGSDTQPPTAPTNLSATAVNSRINLSWTAHGQCGGEPATCNPLPYDLHANQDRRDHEHDV